MFSPKRKVSHNTASLIFYLNLNVLLLIEVYASFRIFVVCAYFNIVLITVWVLSLHSNHLRLHAFKQLVEGSMVHDINERVNLTSVLPRVHKSYSSVM